MAKIDKTLMRDWKDGDKFTSTDYRRERDLIVTAVNDTDATLTARYDNATIDQKLTDNANGDHKGTWQGYTPQQIKDGLAITPAQIGAATQTQVDSIANDVTNLKKRYNLAQYPRLTGETDDNGRFSRAIQGVPAGGELFVPEGSYTADTIIVNKDLSIVFEGNATIESVSTDKNIFEFRGTRGSNDYKLTGAVSRTAREVELEKYPSDIVAGDMVVLTDDTTHGGGVSDINTEIHEVVSLTSSYSNVIQNSAMTQDTTPADGFPDYYTGSISFNPQSNVTGTRTIDTGQSAAKIDVTQTLSNGLYGFSQIITGIVAGKYYNAYVDAKILIATGAPTVSFKVYWYSSTDGSGSFIQQHFLDVTPAEFTRIGHTNLQAPTGAQSARVEIGFRANAAGDTGTVWCKNMDFRRADTKVQFRDYVRLPKSVAATSNLYKVNPISFNLRNVTLKLKEGSTTGSGVYAEYVRRVVLNGVKATRFGKAGIEITKGIHINIEKFRMDSPQVNLGFEQGYGVYLKKGCSHVTIRDGFTSDCRTGVVLDSVQEALVDNVVNENSTLNGFNGSIYGHSADITFQNCRALNCSGDGFQFTSSAPDFSVFTQYGHKITDCEAVISNNTVADGVFVETPIKDLLIKGLKVRYMSGNEANITSLNNAGIRLYPAKTSANIQGCVIEGFKRGVYLMGAVAVTNDYSRITVRDSAIRNCDYLFSTTYGDKRRVNLYNIMADNILSRVINIGTTGSWAEFVMDGISITNSASATFLTGTFANPGGDFCRGRIANIRTDRTPITVSVAASFTLTYENIFFNGDGEVVSLTDTGAVTSSASPLPNGLVEGQRLILVIDSGATGNITLNKGSNMLLSGNATTRVLSTTASVATQFVWRNGKWYELVW